MTECKDKDTYVYIDVSNIRLACWKTLNFRIDFVKLLEYFEGKYPNLKGVRYYEGIANGDEKKRKMFDFLADRGYVICSLERKSYVVTESEEREVECSKCGNKWKVGFIREHRAMKSNVDVYLVSDMVARASRADCPTRLVLVSCDGDYAEAIKTAISLNDNISIAVLATPYVKDIKKNTLSMRLKTMRGKLPRYTLNNIENILPKIRSNVK